MLSCNQFSKFSSQVVCCLRHRAARRPSESGYQSFKLLYVTHVETRWSCCRSLLPASLPKCTQQPVLNPTRQNKVLQMIALSSKIGTRSLIACRSFRLTLRSRKRASMTRQRQERIRRCKLCSVQHGQMFEISLPYANFSTTRLDFGFRSPDTPATLSNLELRASDFSNGPFHPTPNKLVASSGRGPCPTKHHI